MLESRKAFDLSRYVSDGDLNQKALERDTAALVIESSGEIHNFFLALLADGRVVNPSVSKTKDVARFYAIDSPQTLKEREAGLKVRQALINKPEGTLLVWISPPGGEFNYEEGRFEIARIRNILGIKVLQSYGIPLQNVSPEYCEKLFLMLEEFSSDPAQNINSPEDLRNKIVTFSSPDGSNWLNFLPTVFPELKPIFTKIKNGETHHLKMKAIKDSKKVVKKSLETKTYQNRDLIELGAGIERQMQSLGWNLKGRGCGVLNSDLLIPQSSRVLNRGMFGMTSLVDSEENKEDWHWHTGDCVVKNCGRKNVEVGPCDVCRLCQEKFDKGEMLEAA
jgi:hypothetical protein